MYKDLNRDSPDGHFQCDNDNQTWLFIMSFSLADGDPYVPEEAGFPIEDGDQIILEVHYHNPYGLTGNDNTSVTLYLAKELRAYDAGVLVLGNGYSTLQPGQAEVAVETICDTNNLYPLLPDIQRLTNPATVNESFLHMHALGSKIWTDVIRKGEFVGGEGSGPLGKNMNWNYNLQLKQSLNFVIEPGDLLKTTCLYDTRGQTDVVRFGEGSEDEMCFNYIYYFTAVPIPWWPPCGALPPQ